MNNKLRQAYVTPDGKTFETAAEARDYLRKPLIETALKRIAAGDANLAGFLLEQQDEIEKAFEAGVVARVTKSERGKLKKSLEYLKTVTDPKLKFIQDNSDAVLESFRWPSVKRLTPEEKAIETLTMLKKLADENAANWIAKNKDAILAAYEAGIEKRIMNPKAMEALEASRAAKKAAVEAAKAKAA